jgi:hypothetical protein
MLRKNMLSALFINRKNGEISAPLKHKRVIIFLLVFFTFFFVMGVYKKTEAQMTKVYPKSFHLSGLIELSYVNYGYFSDNNGKTTESERSFFLQNYGITLEGYIYHPRLAVFTAGITYRDYRQIQSIHGAKTNTNNIGYNLSLTLLPYRPVSLDLYASKIDYTIDSHYAPVTDYSILYYGSRLRIRKGNWPSIRLEYLHQESDLLNFSTGSAKMVTETYTLDIRGSLKTLHTVYNLYLEYFDFSGPDASFTGKYIHINTSSMIKKDVFLDTSFNYSNLDTAKFWGFSTQLFFTPGRRFNHSYSYTYDSSENRFKGLVSQGIEGSTTKDTIHSLFGSWGYRLTDRLRSSLSLKYGIHDDDIGSSHFYGVSALLSYGRPFAGFNFSSNYRIILRKDEERGELLEHEAELDMTKTLRWAVLYVNYTLILSKQKDKFLHGATDEFSFDDTGTVEENRIDSLSHSLRVGIRGRGAGRAMSRAYWSIESELFSSNVDIERPRKGGGEFDDFFDSEIEKIHRKINRYSVIGSLSHPLGWVNFNFNTGYFLGETDALRFNKFFYEENIMLPVRRNFLINVRYKETWEKYANNSREQLRDYGIEAHYIRGKTHLSLDGRILSGEIDGNTSSTRRFFIRLRRAI